MTFRERQAIQCEISALESNRTCEAALPPKNKTIIGCKWVFKIKYKADGIVKRYKARLVAKGYKKKIEDIDYLETFSPIAKITTIKLLLYLASIYSWS